MKRVRAFALVLSGLFAGVLLLSGCSGGGGAAVTPSAGGPGAAAAPNVAPPTIAVLEPAAGTAVSSGDLVVKVEATNLEFVMPGNTNVPGQGHVHFTLDDQPFQMSVEPEYTFKDVKPGPHRLKAELVQNNTDSFDPPVEEQVEFTVR